MKALLIEDDYYFAEEIVSDLETAVPDLRGQIEIIRTEKQLRDRLASSQPLQYQFIILDIMLTWGDASPKPEDVVVGGYFKAGLRCLKLLRDHASSANTPVIIHSARESEEIIKELRAENMSMDKIVFVTKSGSPTALVEEVKASLLPSPLSSGRP